MEARYDVVIYGATGVTGGKIFETLISCGKFDNYSIAIAGRSEKKLEEVLEKLEKSTGTSLKTRIGLLVCDSTNEESMGKMARRAKLIVNAVGPFRLHGEAVVKAAVENGANQIDVAGEPEWIERMEAKYGQMAKNNNVYIVSACGWDSIPADFGVKLLKRYFDGHLQRIDAFLQLHFGPSGYSFSATSLQALLLGFNGAPDLGSLRHSIMPKKIDHLLAPNKKRHFLWKIEEKGSEGWAMPFLGADKSIVTRSQYFDYVMNNVKPVRFTPFTRFESRWNALLLAALMGLLKTFSKYGTMQRFIMRYPELCSGKLFSKSGPSEEQMKEATFTYQFYGYGYGRGDPRDREPKKKLLVTCTGPDVGYIATSGCVLSSVLVFLKEKEKLPKSMSRYDVVVYGASGFTGAYVVEYLVNSEQFEGLSFAVAGRSEKKLREVLRNISQKTGKDVSNAAVIVADSADERSLNEMARQANVVINAVGPYRLYGEAVVKAAVENGASHVDISGEPAWIEKMQQKYSKQAKEQGVYVVSACGWDSIPADLGVNFLKKNFHGDLNHVESFVQLLTGPSGYSFNAGTYQTLILGLSGAATDKLGAVRKEIMPEKIVRGAVKLPKRPTLWEIKEKELNGVAVPFPGADKSIINRSQYYDATSRQVRPIHMETYIRLSSQFYGYLIGLWIMFLSIFVKYPFTRRILQQYPDQCSFYMFKNSGPSARQMAEASFVYWFFGYGYKETLPLDQQHEGKINRKVLATCKGPDAGYIATSGCVLSAALTLIRDKDNLPKDGGVYTTAAAFGNSKIYDYLASFGITYQLESEYDL